MMKKMVSLGATLFMSLMMSACAVNQDLQQQNPTNQEMQGDQTEQEAQREVVNVFPEDVDSAARFLVSHPNERWILLVNDDGAGNAILANQKRITYGSDGVNGLWLQMVFSQPLYIKIQESDVVRGALIYTQVRCADNTFRSTQFYAVNEAARIVDVVDQSYAPFQPLDSGAVATSIYRMACEAN